MINIIATLLGEFGCFVNFYVDSFAIRFGDSDNFVDFY